MGFDYQYSGYVYIGSAYSINQNNGTFSITADKQQYYYNGDGYETFSNNHDVYFVGNNNKDLYWAEEPDGKCAWKIRADSLRYRWDDMMAGDFEASKITKYTSTTTYTKGSTSYGDVASSGSGTYPTNSYSGNYWYVYKGSDTIDPTAVSYDASTVIAGETVSVTISPSSGNSYGGTITYSVEVNVDETGWEPYTETTSTSFTFTIPEDAVSWRCRVKARDNLGFT